MSTAIAGGGRRAPRGPSGELVLARMDQRLRVVGAALDVPLPAEAGDPIALLEKLVASIGRHVDSAGVWLLLTGLTAQFPMASTVHGMRRRIELMTARDAATWLMQGAVAMMSSADAVAEIDVLTDRPLVDVDFSVGNDLATGIQRVVRNLVPRWRAEHLFEPVRWEDDHAFRPLTSIESSRLFGDATDAGGTGRRIVPWQVPILLPEVPFPVHAQRLSAMAELSPNSVRAIGYDCIPITSAELVWRDEHEKFGTYLELVKHLDVVAGISETSAAEFRGFASTLASQGLRGPQVVACSLPTTAPVELPAGSGEAGPTSDRLEVLCVGSPARRKNQIALVEACEYLWRSGLDFTLRLLGSGGDRPDQLIRLIERFQKEGREIVFEEEVSDAAIAQAYGSARVVVLPTLHEGFGLPIVEALSMGIPVITSDFGSTREIAEGQGALLVDPEHPAQLAEALRRVLAQDAVHAELVAQSRDRDPRTWDDYAADLWEAFS